MPSEDVQTVFDDLAACYDRLIDWPRRLAREGPFFRRLFQENGVRRVLDVGCGTGHHAALFHAWGLDVAATDVSPAMLDRCRELHEEDGHLTWRQKSFSDLPLPGKPFDAVVCVGNSLALADGLVGMRDGVRGMIQSVQPGGIGLIQVLNLESIPEGGEQWQKIRRLDHGDEPSLLLKGLHRVRQRGFVDVLDLKLRGTGVEWRAHSASFFGINLAQLSAAIRDWGGEVSAVYGSYDQEKFVENHSADLIVHWRHVRCGQAPGGTLTRALRRSKLKSDMKVEL